MNRNRLWTGFVVLVTLATGCFTPAVDDSVSVEGEITAGKNTIVLNDKTLDYLSGFDGTSLIFDGSPAQLRNLEAGSIVVVRPTETTPNGALLEVTSIDNGSGTVTVDTKQSSLSRALRSADIRIHKTISKRDLGSPNAFSPKRKGVSMGASKGSFDVGPLQIDFENVVLYDADDNHATTKDQLTLSGDVSFAPSFQFDLSIEWFQLKDFSYSNTITQTANLHFKTGDVPAEVANIQETWEVATYNLPPIVISVGGFPIIFTPIIHVKVGLDGRITTSIDASLSEQTITELGLAYSDGTWQPVNNFSLNVGLDVEHLSTDLQLRPHVGPQIDILLYGIIGPYVYPKAYLELVAEGELEGSLSIAAQTGGQNGQDGESQVEGALTGNVHWELYAGLTADIGIRMTVLDYDLVNESTPIFDFKYLLHSGDAQGELVYNTGTGGDAVCREECSSKWQGTHFATACETICD